MPARHQPPVRIIHGSAEDLSALEDNSVTLTVTSPPYWNAIDYDVHVSSDGREWYRTRRYSLACEEHQLNDTVLR